MCVTGRMIHRYYCVYISYCVSQGGWDTYVLLFIYFSLCVTGRMIYLYIIVYISVIVCHRADETPIYYSQQTQNIHIAFIQRRPCWFNIALMLYKCFAFAELFIYCVSQGGWDTYIFLFIYCYCVWQGGWDTYILLFIYFSLSVTGRMRHLYISVYIFLIVCHRADETPIYYCLYISHCLSQGRWDDSGVWEDPCFNLPWRGCTLGTWRGVCHNLWYRHHILPVWSTELSGRDRSMVIQEL